MAELFNTENLFALLTLTSLEIVLGIDNIVFIAILTGKLPAEQQPKARRIGLLLAMVMRILLLLSIFWIMKLDQPFYHIDLFGWKHGISGKDVILLLGGLFLIGKATYEIHDKLEGGEEHAGPKAAAAFGMILLQILLIDLVFSLDSIITAVGMAKRVEVMIVAVVIAVGVMLAFAGRISAFVEKHPTIKMLALSFLLLIGMMLVADGLGQHIPKGYIYFSMAFSLFVEILNIRLRRKAKPVQLHHTHLPEMTKPRK